MSLSMAPGTAYWLREQECDLAQFRRLVEQVTQKRDYPRASRVESNVVIYEADALREKARGEQRETAAELGRALLQGPGIVVMRGAFATSVVDAATEVYSTLMKEEEEAGQARGDHFAKPGTNQRLWDSLGKLALRAPEVWADYFSNDILALVSTAWLGPAYQVTAQVNLVNPGGVAQAIHRDYHLGFMTNAEAARYPWHVHQLSPVLTLQGAVAHCDMPVDSGPTLYVPYSHQYLAGYLCWRSPELASYCAGHYVQLALEKGDASFFNPAVFHAAGSNRSQSIRRMANLLQISSAFGRAMETVDREAIVNSVYPVLLQRKKAGAPDEWLRNAVAASAEGYAFPTNLDRDPPLEGLAPSSPAELVWRALAEERAPEQLRAELRAASERRQA